MYKRLACQPQALSMQIPPLSIAARFPALSMILWFSFPKSMRELLAPPCCSIFTAHFCIPASHFLLLDSPPPPPKAVINAISLTAPTTLLEGLVMGTWARVCVAIAVTTVTLVVGYVLQVQPDPLGSMTTGPPSGDVPVRISLGRMVHVSPLLTVRLPSAKSLYPRGCRKISR